MLKIKNLKNLRIYNLKKHLNPIKKIKNKNLVLIINRKKNKK